MYDLDKIRASFPMLNKEKTMQGKHLVFLDSSSTTFKPTCVIDAINNYYVNETANSHRGDYDLCYNVDQDLLKARKTVARFVNSDPNEVIFTSGTTMSLNMVALCYGLKYLKKDDEILLTVAEHASNLLPWFKVAKQVGAKIKFIPLTKEGRITLDNVKKTLTNKTKVVSLAHITNVLGYMCDVKEIAKLAHSVGAIMVVDGAQSVPHIKTDFKDWDIDFLAFSAHKMCGPTGVGALIGKASILKDLDPLFGGGGMNVTFYESGDIEYLESPVKFESGTLNLAGIFGFKRAIEFIEEIGIENIHNHEKELKEYAIKEMEKLDNVIIYNKDSEGSMITFNVKGVFAQDEATLLNSKGIAVRSGQHCAKILNNFLDTPATVRASLALYSSKEDIDALIDSLRNGGDILDAYFND